MKKMICALLAALLCFLAGAALAEEDPPATEEAITAFEHTWACQTDPNDTVEIWFDGEAWHISAMQLTGEDVYSIEFSACFYDKVLDCLLCMNGLKVRGLFLDSGKDDTWSIVGEVDAEGFYAILTLDEDGLLHWTGSGDASPDRLYVNWDEKDDGLFTGAWISGDAFIDITLHGDAYTAIIYQPVGDTDFNYWEYACVPDASGALAASESEDVFTLEGDTLIWHSAGEETPFTRMVDTETEEDAITV